MAIDFTQSPGRVRMLIGDTNEASPIFTDAEITALLALNQGDVFGAAADGCRALAASTSKQAILFSTLSGELNVDQQKVPMYFLQLAAKYDEQRGRMDTRDYRVEWPLLVDNRIGRDDTVYDSTDNEEIFDLNYEKNGA